MPGHGQVCKGLQDVAGVGLDKPGVSGYSILVKVKSLTDTYGPTRRRHHG